MIYKLRDTRAQPEWQGFINRNTNLMILVYNYFIARNCIKVPKYQSIALAILVIVLKYPIFIPFCFDLPSIIIMVAMNYIRLFPANTLSYEHTRLYAIYSS